MSRPGTVLDPLYGLVAWPSTELDGWLRQQQRRLGVRAYGEPHLNLRALFCSRSSEEHLIAELRALLADTSSFEVRIRGWRTFPGIVFLECERSPELLALHERVLTLPTAPPQPHDQREYLPHLTLALGVLPWTQQHLEQQLTAMTWPVQAFRVSALSLTRETGGEVREVHTFPLREGGQ